MARVERYTAQGQIPVEQAQLIDPGAFPADLSSAKALEVAGGIVNVFAELGIHKLEMQDRIGISKINAAMENAEREYQAEIIDKPLEEHAAILQKHRSEAIAFASKQKLSSETRELVDNKLRIWADFFTDKGEIVNIKATERDAVIRVTADYEKALTEGNEADIEEAEIALDAQYKISYTPAEAKMMKEEVIVRGYYNFAINYLEGDPEGFLKDIKNKKFLPELDAQLRSQLKRRARTQIGMLLSIQRELREQQTNAEQGRLMQLARTGELTDEIIRNSQLDEFGTGSKDTFYGILDRLADAALEGKEAPFKESNPRIEALVLDKIRDPKEKITPKDISNLVAKGLSIDDADRMISRLDMFKDPWFGRIDTWLKGQLGWDAAYEKFLHPEGGISYKVAIDQLFDAIETEKLRGRDIYERGTELAIPAMVDYWEKVLSLEKPQIERMRRMLKGKPETKKPGRAKTQPTKSEIDPEGIFQ